MFTGIIQGLGEIMQVQRSNLDSRFSFRPLFDMSDINDGESIAVNGVCLSVENHSQYTFAAYASHETLIRTTLSRMHAGEKVNLERAIAFGERLGGHLVSGHIDCIATVISRSLSGQSIIFRFEFPREFSPEVITKGSVALDGISLTINECGDGYLEVNVIPDTQKRTNLPSWKPGIKVNMETDLIGKYVLRVMRTEYCATTATTARQKGVSREFLSDNGFI